MGRFATRNPDTTTVVNEVSFSDIINTPTTLEGYGITDNINTGAPLNSPTFTGVPAAPTPALGTSTTQLATTAFVNAEIANDAPTKTGGGAIGTWGIAVTGNAGSATVLDTARTINGVAFDGSTNINVTAIASDVNAWAKAPAKPAYNATEIGLGSVDNTADTAKPVSTAQQTALNLKANIASPTLTGIPAAPTAIVGTNTTQIATTAFVGAEIANDATPISHIGTGAAAHAVVTTAVNGFMSAVDKIKLDSIASGAGSGVDSVAGKTGTVTLVKADVGLDNVDNTADTAKPVSTAQATAIGLKANIAGPALTGIPTAPTAAVGTSTTQLATTAFVGAEIANDAAPIAHVGSSGAAHAVATISVNGFMSAVDKAKLDGIPEGGGTGGGGDVTSVAGRTGAVVLTKSDVGLSSVDNTTDTSKPVSTAQAAAIALKANIASPALTGVPTAPTAALNTNTTQLATTAFVINELANGGTFNNAGIVIVTNTTVNAVTNNYYILKNVAMSTLFLPVSPVEGDVIWITVGNGLKTNTIDNNGKTIAGNLEPLIIDMINLTLELRFLDNDWRLL